MGKVIMISSPVKDNLDMMINKMAPAMNRQSIIIVHPATWEELIEELMLASNDNASWTNFADRGCSYRNIIVYRSQDYPVGQCGIYL